jgi:hypothetical protein
MLVRASDSTGRGMPRLCPVRLHSGSDCCSSCLHQRYHLGIALYKKLLSKTRAMTTTRDDLCCGAKI